MNDATTLPRATRAGVASDHASIAARRNPRALLATVLRTRSRHAREVLAEVAWPGHSPHELEELAGRGLGGGLPIGSDAVGVADYGKALAVQFAGAADRRIARELLEAVAGTSAWEIVRGEHVEVLMHLRLFDGDLNDAVDLSEDPRLRQHVGAAVRADALNPSLHPEPDPNAWMDAFNIALHGAALAPLLPPAPGAPPSLDDLVVEGSPRLELPERITVLMSTFQRAGTLLTAARSVLSQTWTNLELLVVDDASGPGGDGEWSRTLEQVEALDPRVTVIRKVVNGGTYRARNTALKVATGDFAIVIDSDDWWHPQTLELCVAPLLADKGLIATRAQGVRVTPDLLISRIGYQPRFPSAPTVMYRLPEVLNRIGFYDPTRKGADNEHARRMEAAFGRPIHDIKETTTLQRAGAENLSASEFANGWRHPARHLYASAYRPWHQDISSGSASPFLDPDTPRLFPEPLRWQDSNPFGEATRESVDLCLAGDWRRMGGPQQSMLQEMDAALAAGLSVGVMHMEALRFMTHRDSPVVRDLIDRLRRGSVRWILPDDDVDIGVLIVRYPPILQYPPTLPSHVRARQVLVMANQAPLERDGRDERYVVSDVSSRAEELFGVPAVWVPQSPTIRRVLREQDPDVRMTNWDNPGIIPTDEWRVRAEDPPRLGDRPIVIGRHSRDDPIKFPGSFDELLRGYKFGRDFEVRMLGAARTTQTLLSRSNHKRMPENWTLLEHQEGDVRSFLRDLDFYVYHDDPDAHEAFGRSLLEAAASGVLVIASPKHRPTFGEMFEYADPGEAQGLVREYLADPESYRRRVRRTIDLVRRNFGGEAFVAQIREMLGPRSTPSPFEQRPSTVLPVTLYPVVPSADEGWSACAHETSRGHAVRTLAVALRSAADGERSESVTVLVQPSESETVAHWLRQRVRGFDGSAGDAEARWVASAPPGVLAVLLRRDGLVWALTRHRWSSAPRDLPGRLAGRRPNGWRDTAWWERHPPESLTLEERKGDGTEDDSHVYEAKNLSPGA